MRDRAALSERTAPTEAPGGGDYVSAYYIDYERIWKFLRRHYVSIIRGACLGAAAALLYIVVAAPVFTAQTQLLIDPALANVLREQSIERPIALDSQQLETEIAVLRSEEISTAVIEGLKLADEPEFRVSLTSDYLPSWATSASTRTDAERIRKRLVLTKFRKNLVVRRIGVSYAIDIFYSTSDPELAARIANSVADAYMQFQVDSRTKAARVGSQWLEERLGDLRTAMNAAARKLQEHRASQDYSIASRGEGPAGGGAQKANAELDKAQSQSLTFEELESTATTYRRIYENFLQSFMSAVQRQSFPISNAQIITKASSSLTQSRPTGLILALAALFGACGGVGAGLLRGRSKAKTTSPRQNDAV